MKIKLFIPVTGIPQNTFDEISGFLRKYLDKSCELQFASLNYGFPSVENELSGMVNGAQTAVQLHVEKKQGETVQGVFIDCFDDPAVYQCREMLKIPVVGAYSAAVSTAIQCAERIGIITTDDAGILNEEKKAREAGLAGRIVSIRALTVSVAEIITNRDKVLDELTQLCVKMADEDRVSCICLGCTAMFYVYEELLQRLKALGSETAVIEPTLNGILTLQNLIRMGVGTHVPGEPDFKELNWIQGNRYNL